MRRKELGLTQRELADRLFVTESAVSKWERGLSYPDITLVRELCAALDISEHELLTASEDAEARTIQHLARRYLSLIQTCRRVQFLLYGALALIFLIANLAEGRMGWFGIALAGELMAMSITLIPVLTERNKAVWTIGGLTLSLILLLGACALYSGENWFLPAALGTLLAEGVLLLPLVLRQLPLTSPLCRHKAAVVRNLFGAADCPAGRLLPAGEGKLVLVARPAPRPAGPAFALEPGGDSALPALLPLVSGRPELRRGAVWLFCLPWAAEQLVSSPEVSLDQRHPFGLHPAIAQWSDPAAQAENVLFLLCLLLAISGLLLALAGRRRRNGVPTQGKE